MTASEAWAGSAEGVSDLLRFFHARRRDLSRHELVCVFETLPPESATCRKVSDAPMGLDTVLLATIADRLSAIGTGLGGGKLKESQLLAPALTREGAEKAKVVQDRKKSLVEGLKRTHSAKKPVSW